MSKEQDSKYDSRYDNEHIESDEISSIYELSPEELYIEPDYVGCCEESGEDSASSNNVIRFNELEVGKKRETDKKHCEQAQYAKSCDVYKEIITLRDELDKLYKTIDSLAEQVESIKQREFDAPEYESCSEYTDSSDNMCDEYDNVENECYDCANLTDELNESIDEDGYEFENVPDTYDGDE